MIFIDGCNLEPLFCPSCRLDAVGCALYICEAVISAHFLAITIHRHANGANGFTAMAMIICQTYICKHLWLS